MSDRSFEALFVEIWHELLLACDPQQSPRQFMQVSTVYENQAFSRMVVLRACEMERRSISFYTDYRSKKVQQLLQNPKMACLFYNYSQRTQIRLMSSVQLQHKNAFSQEHWSALSVDKQLNYASKLAPGSLSESNKNTQQTIDLSDFNPDLAYENFVVVHAMVHEIEYLNIKKPHHQRVNFVYTNGSWTSKAIIP